MYGGSKMVALSSDSCVLFLGPRGWAGNQMGTHKPVKQS